jgi:steroid delta-isomerase
MTPAAARYIRYLESLAPKTLDVMGDYVADDVHFSDPFNDVHGVESMAGVFRHMFDNIKDIEYRIHRAAMDENTCLMRENWGGGNGPSMAAAR